MKAVGKIFIGTENIVGYAQSLKHTRVISSHCTRPFKDCEVRLVDIFKTQTPKRNHVQRMLSQEDDGHTYVLKEANKQLPERSQCLPQRGIHNMQEEEIGKVRALGNRQEHILSFGF